MQVGEVMTRKVHMIDPGKSIEEAAKLMAEADTGVLPVGEGDELIGMLTDRDIAIRAIAQGKSAQTAVRDIMSPEVKYCFEDEDVEHIAQNLGDQQIRRLPVVNRAKRLVGILSLCDLVQTDEGRRHSGDALGKIARPGGKHSQQLHH